MDFVARGELFYDVEITEGGALMGRVGELRGEEEEAHGRGMIDNWRLKTKDWRLEIGD
jgi:hypothetical protein